MKKGFLIKLFIVFGLIILPSVNNYAIEEIEGEEIRLYLGESKMIPVNNPTRVFIGNPGIADVVDVSSTDITLNPKAAGTTSLMFRDNFGEQYYKIRVFAENLDDIKRRIDSALKSLNLSEVYTQILEEEGKVSLLGRVKTAQDRERIATALGSLKDKTIDLIQVKEEEAVVGIDVQVLELSEEASKTLGFTWPTQLNITEVASPGIPHVGAVDVVTGTTPSTSYSVTNTGTPWSSLFRIVGLSRNAFTLTLDALVEEGKARILSRPHLTCQSGKEAELLVGGEKPIFGTTLSETGNVATEIEYKEYGIKLKIKPIVNEDRRIKLGLNIEVSDIEPAESIGSTTTVFAKAYPLKKRNVSTEVFLNDGQTLAIGGLIKKKTEESVSKFAGLGDIPILGALFRKTTKTTGGGEGEKGTVELFVTLTPRISGENPEYKKVSKSPMPPPAPRAAMAPTPAAAPVLTNTSSTAGASPVVVYANVIKQRILQNVVYPSSAKAAGFEGVVKLDLIFSSRGRLLEASIKESSGYATLDDNALDTVRGIPSYPPFPPSIDSEELQIEVPVVYQLD